MCKRLSSTSSSRDDKACRTWHCRQIAYTSGGRGTFASPSPSHMTQGRLLVDEESENEVKGGWLGKEGRM